MKWKEMVLGGVVTLIVTVAAALVVHLLTKEPAAPPQTEKVVFAVDKIGVLGQDTNTQTFVTIRVKNIGSVSADDVRVVLPIKSGTSLADKQMSSSAGAAIKFEDSSNSNQLDVTLPILRPTEIVTISLLLRGSATDALPISVQSHKYIASPGPLNPAPPSTPNGLNAKQIVSLVFIALLAQIILIPAANSWFQRFISQYIPTIGNRNNVAFLYLQQGLISEAKSLLELEIHGKGGGAIEIANYGLAVGLSGDAALAAKHFEAAEWWARTRHEKSVVAYNRSVWFLFNGDNSEAHKQLKDALKLGRAEIRRYAELNSLIKAARLQDAGLDALLTT